MLETQSPDIMIFLLRAIPFLIQGGGNEAKQVDQLDPGASKKLLSM